MDIMVGSNMFGVNNSSLWHQRSKYDINRVDSESRLLMDLFLIFLVN